MSIPFAIGGLLLLVFIHELGHFLAAKTVGMRATRFSVGFGPALLSRTHGDTEYRLAALPLGGYVRIVGHGASAARRSRRGRRGRRGGTATPSGATGPIVSARRTAASRRPSTPERTHR